MPSLAAYLIWSVLAVSRKMRISFLFLPFALVSFPTGIFKQSLYRAGVSYHKLEERGNGG